MANVGFSNSVPAVRKKYFDDLKLNASYVIDSPKSVGATYRKVCTGHGTSSPVDTYFALEEYTGRLFAPPHSPVKEVNVVVEIEGHKPSIY